MKHQETPRDDGDDRDAGTDSRAAQPGHAQAEPRRKGEGGPETTPTSESTTPIGLDIPTG